MYKGASQKARNCLILHFLHNWFWTGNNKKMLVPNLEFWQCKIYSVWKLYILWNPFIIVYSSINEAECLRLGMILGCGYNQSLLTVHLLGPGWGGGAELGTLVQVGDSNKARTTTLGIKKKKNVTSSVSKLCCNKINSDNATDNNLLA